MSHITKIDLLIKDLDALEKACGKLGTVELVRGQKTFQWFGRFMGDSRPPKEMLEQGYTVDKYGTCDHAIRVKGNRRAYEIGLIQRADGKGYMLAWDSWRGGGGLLAATGYDTKDTAATKLKDWYAAEVAKKQMRRQGFRVTAKQQDRKVRVLCNK